MPLRFLIDEDTRDHRLIEAIEAHNAANTSEPIDYVCVGDISAPPTQTDDFDLVVWAHGQGRIILSHDKNTLIATHSEYVAAGNSTPGLLIVKRGVSFPHLVEYLHLIAYYEDPEAFRSATRYIPDI